MEKNKTISNILNSLFLCSSFTEQSRRNQQCDAHHCGSPRALSRTAVGIFALLVAAIAGCKSRNFNKTRVANTAKESELNRPLASGEIDLLLQGKYAEAIDFTKAKAEAAALLNIVGSSAPEASVASFLSCRGGSAGKAVPVKRKLYLYNWNSRSDAAEPSKLVANVARDLVQTLARNLDPNRFLEGGHAGSGLYLSADPLASMAFGQNLVLFKIKEGTQFRPASKNPSADYFAGFCPLHEYRWSSAGKAVVQENSEIAFVLHDASIIDPADTLILMNARGRDFHLSSLAERSEQGLLNGIVFLDFWESVSEKTTINDIKLEIFMRAIRRILMDPNLFADGSARTAALAIRARALAIQPNLLEGKRGPNFERALDRRRLGFERPVVREGFPGGADELETIFAAFGVPFEDLDNTIGYTARGIPIPNVLRTVDSVLSQFATPNERELLGRAQKDPATLGVEMRQWKQDWIRFLREFSW